MLPGARQGQADETVFPSNTFVTPSEAAESTANHASGPGATRAPLLGDGHANAAIRRSDRASAERPSRPHGLSGPNVGMRSRPQVSSPQVFKSPKFPSSQSTTAQLQHAAFSGARLRLRLPETRRFCNSWRVESDAISGILSRKRCARRTTCDSAMGRYAARPWLWPRTHLRKLGRKSGTASGCERSSSYTPVVTADPLTTAVHPSSRSREPLRPRSSSEPLEP